MCSAQAIHLKITGSDFMKYKILRRIVLSLMTVNGASISSLFLSLNDEE